MTSFRLDADVLEPLVRKAFGPEARVASVEPIGQWSVARVRVELPGMGEDSLIVKALRNLPSGVRAEQSRILNEQAALEFVGEIDQSLAPRLLAADAAHGIVAIEDLSRLVPLNEALLSGQRTAGEGLKLFSLSLSRLHGATVGKRDNYYRKRAEMGPTSSYDQARLVLGAWDWRLPCLAQGGLVATPAAHSEMRDAEVLLCEPGPLTAFSNGDPGLHNFLTDGNQSRIIDWEDACFRHVAHDISCIWVPNSVWMTLADPVELGVDRIYRDAVTDAVPAAGTSKRRSPRPASPAPQTVYSASPSSMSVQPDTRAALKWFSPLRPLLDLLTT